MNYGCVTTLLLKNLLLLKTNINIVYGISIPLKKSANSAYLELKNHLNKKLQKVEGLIEQKLKVKLIL